MPNRKRSLRTKITVLCAALAVVILINSTQSPSSTLGALSETPADKPAAANSTTDYSLANCRYGTTGGAAAVKVGLIEKLGVGAFYRFDDPYWDWTLPKNGAERFLMIRIKQEKTKDGAYLPKYVTEVPLDQDLVDLIRENSGALWFLGNEIERGPNPGKTHTSQGDIYPDIYAEAYHDVYYFIKSIDPTARVSIAGLIQATPMRLQYLDHLWAAYLEKYGEPMPVDVWNIHLYVLPELTPEGEPNKVASVALGTDKSLGKRESGRDASRCQDPDVYCYAEHDDLEIIAEQLVAIRQWMKDHGQQDKPLIVSEYSTLYHLIYEDDGSCKGLRDEFGECFLPDRVSKYVVDSFAYFNQAMDPDLGFKLDGDRLVQQWIWFNSTWDLGTGRLNEPGSPELTPVGITFRDTIHADPTYVNLIVDGAGATVSQNADGSYDADLSVTFRNNGNVAIEEDFKISFYRDAELTQLIGRAAVDSMVRGCATKSYSASITWPALPEGTYQFWVKLDSGHVISEKPGKSDNIGRAMVVADPSAPIYSLDVQIGGSQNNQGGSVRKEPDAQMYANGQEVTLTATPFSGWRFDGWSGDISGIDASINLKMDGDKSVQANFRRELYQVRTTVTGEGFVRKNPRKDNYIYGDNVLIYAAAAPGWRFSGWSGTLNEGRSLLDLTVTRSEDLTANFVQFLPEVIDEVYLPVSAAQQVRQVE